MLILLSKPQNPNYYESKDGNGGDTDEDVVCDAQGLHI